MYSYPLFLNYKLNDVVYTFLLEKGTYDNFHPILSDIIVICYKFVIV